MASTVLPWQWVVESLAGNPDAGTSIFSALVDRFPFVLGDSSNAVRERLALRYLEDRAGMGCGETPPAVATNVTSTVASAAKIDPFKTCEEVLLSKVASANDHTKENAGLDDGDLHQLILRKRVALQKSSIELLKENILGSYVPDFSHSKDYNSLVKDLRCRVWHLDCSSHRDQNGIKKMINTMKCASPLMKRFTLISKYRKLKNRANTSLKSVGGASQEASNLFQHLDNGKKNHQTTVDDTCNDFQVEKTGSDPVVGSAEFHDVEIHSLRENLPGNVSFPNVPPDNLEVSLSGLHDIPEGCENVQLLEQCSMPQSSSTQSLCIKCCSSGQLLNCCGDGCSRAIHESCLGLLDGVEKTDLFYCPFCSYRNARIVFEKSKRKVQEARRNLLSFYGIDPSVHAPKGKTSGKIMIDLNESEQFMQENVDTQNHETSGSKFTGDINQGITQNEENQLSGSRFNIMIDLNESEQFMQENVDTQNHETSGSKFAGDINQGITQNEENQLNVKVDINCKPSKETIETFSYQEVPDTPTELNREAGNEHESTQVTKYQQPVNDLGTSEHTHLPYNQQFMQENVDTQNHETSGNKFTVDINQRITQNEENQLNVKVDINCKPSKEAIETFTCEEFQDTHIDLNSEAGNECETRVTIQQPANDGLSFELRTPHERNDDVCVNTHSNVATRDHLEIGNGHTFDAEKEQLSIKLNQRSILKGEGRCDYNTKRKALASKIKVKFAKRNRSDKATLTDNYQGDTENKTMDHLSSRELRKTVYRQNLCSSSRQSSSNSNRRLIINWTADEEKILEEAVEKIPHDGRGGMPWKEILKYGNHVLHGSRTAVDLKDKWRNMEKRKAKSRS